MWHTGVDDDYLNQGNNPGKRSYNRLSHFRTSQNMLFSPKIHSKSLVSNNQLYNQILKSNCLNIGGDACSNGELIGSGFDDDYLSGGFNPGK